MSIKAPVGGGKEFRPAPAGTHIARVYKIVHIGKVWEEYQGEEKLVDKVYLSFELPKKLREEDGKPFIVSGEYTNSMHEKSKLRPLVEGILGTTLGETAESFEVTELMGRTCLLNVKHEASKRTGKLYAKIGSASPLVEGMEAPDAVNEQFLLDYNDNWSEMKFNDLSEFLRKKMVESEEYKALKGIDNVDPELASLDELGGGEAN